MVDSWDISRPTLWHHINVGFLSEKYKETLIRQDTSIQISNFTNCWLTGVRISIDLFFRFTEPKFSVRKTLLQFLF